MKVAAFYRWLNGALNGSPKLPLIVNMDECSLAYHQTGIRGTVLRTQPLRSVRPEDRARLGDRRGNITYMASICNDPSFSNVLPQILLGNCQRFAKRVVEELKPSLPGNLFLWREKSAWNNRFQMRRYIKLLRQCLGDEVFQMREVFLVVDMASCHLHPSIPAVARSQGLRMVLVPAGLTSILQPLDTHVFRPFRAKMQELWLACRSNHETGEVSLREWLRLVCKAIQAVVCEQDWEHAFERVGYLYGQALVSPKLLASLEWDSLPLVSPGLPGIGQAASMFPRKSQANVPMWVEWKDPEPYTRIQTLD